MIKLPILTSLRVQEYGLFPGTSGAGIDWSFQPGLCLIAGVNGLGKTTLVTMLLRAFTGPFDLAGEGLPEQLDSITPETPVMLKPRHTRFFAQRVADDAANATFTVGAKLGAADLLISRRLSDLALLSFSVDGEERDLGANRKDREAAFQVEIAQLFDLSSFVDVLLILHHVIFFKEDRPGALWDENAQRHVLRALFLDKTLAAQVAAGERRVQSTDSKARNISANAYSIRLQLQRARSSQEGASEKAIELASEQTLLDAELENRERLEALLDESDEKRKSARREYERAKLFREEAERAVESLKFAAMVRLFPKMEDAARLVLLKYLNTGDCLVCGADSSGKVGEIESLLLKGNCPICGSEPSRQERIVPAHEVESKRVGRARHTADLARTAERSKQEILRVATSGYDSTLDALVDLKRSIQDRTERTKQLKAELPFDAEDVQALEKALEMAVRAQRQAESDRAVASRQLITLLEGGRGAIEKQTKKLKASFKDFVREMIAEDAELVRIEGRAKLTQGAKEIFTVPVFKAQMTAANIPGKTMRNSPNDVSQSQRELIDLAFRLALISVATGGASSTLAMETPEASLDELAMDRVGSALHRFANSGNNRLVVTSNLTNAGMIAAMFGGPTRRSAEIKNREKHVLNLLELAAPNQSVVNNRREYEKILVHAISGTP